jgi:hypothetical protein
MGEKRKAYMLLVGKTPLRRWVDNMEIDLGEVGWRVIDWIGLAQDRDKWRALMNEPSGSIKC